MPTASDVFQMSIVYTAGGQYMESVTHFLSSLTDSTHPQADALSLATAWHSSVESDMLGCWYSDVTLLGYRSKRVNNGGGASAVLIAPAGTVGTYGSGPGMPTSRQCALLEMDYYDNLATLPRWRQGRICMGGVPSPFWADDVWTTDARNAYSAFITAFNVTLGSSPNFRIGIWSRKNSQLWGPTGWELSGRMGYLKRRTKPTL